MDLIIKNVWWIKGEVRNKVSLEIRGELLNYKWQQMQHINFNGGVIFLN